jgi:phosphate starvation-inducible PhoH-like protein
MTETVGKEIMLEGVDPRELYGAQDVYLEQIKSLHPTLKIVARGQSLKVLGPEADTQRFAKRMEGLAAYYVKYGHVSAEVIEQAGYDPGDDLENTPDSVFCAHGAGYTVKWYRVPDFMHLDRAYDAGQ